LIHKPVCDTNYIEVGNASCGKPVGKLYYRKGDAAMNDQLDNSERDEFEDAQQMQRWVRRYAQNRSLPVAVGLVVFVILSAAIAVPSYWGGKAYREGNTTLLVICIGVLVPALAATIYLSIPRWGGRQLQRAAEKLYAREGRVAIVPAAGKRPRWMVAVVVAFFVCVQGHVFLGLLGCLPVGKYMQPISAIYLVPFLLAIHFVMRPAVGPIALLWPTLYALHAVLIVTGAPIVFTAPWDSLNMVIPVAGYGILTALVGHAYSRWALHHVRTLAARQPAGDNRPLDGDHV
jgi:hypothetical protein